jgi:dipeptidyl-peptidase III
MKLFSKVLAVLVLLSAIVWSCNNKSKTDEPGKPDSTGNNVAAPGDGNSYDTNFVVEAESFADLQMLRYQVPGFNGLSLQQKQLAYYLYEAALCGIDIIYDQKSKNGLLIRKTLETAYSTYKGDTNSADWKKFTEYCGRVWFSNGNHHHYGNEKFLPACSFEYFASVVKNSDTASLPRDAGETVQAFLNRIKPILYTFMKVLLKKKWIVFMRSFRRKKNNVHGD